MVRAANPSLRIERDIMLRNPGEKNVFYILFERIIVNPNQQKIMYSIWLAYLGLFLVNLATNILPFCMSYPFLVVGLIYSQKGRT